MAIVVEDVALVVKPSERVTIKVDDPHVLENTVPCGSILVPYYVDLVLFLVSRWFQVITPRIGVKLRRLPMITTHGPLGSPVLSSWSNIQIVGGPRTFERLCQRRALQRSQQDVRERKTSVDVLRGRGVQVESGRQLGSLHSGHSGSISHQRLLDMCL